MYYGGNLENNLPIWTIWTVPQFHDKILCQMQISSWLIFRVSDIEQRVIELNMEGPDWGNWTPRKEASQSIEKEVVQKMPPEPSDKDK